MIEMDKLKTAITDLHQWRLLNGWRGFDPFGIRERLYEKFGRSHTAIRLQRLIAELEKHYGYEQPALFHELLEDKGYLDPKTFANFGTGYLKLYRLTYNEEYLTIAKECGDWLIEDSDKRNIPAWGHPFVWYTEANDYFHKKNNPNIYITSLVIHFLLDLHTLTRDQNYGKTAGAGIRYLSELPHTGGPEESICFWYIIDRKELPIHNGNLFVASVLVRSGDPKHMELAQRAIDFTLKDQNEDGSWYYYGPPRSPKMMFIDNYHSGFILEALSACNKILKRDDIQKAIELGLNYYKQMFTSNGEPFRLGGAPFPQDIHDAAQGIMTFCLLSDIDSRCMDTAGRITRWAIQEMQAPEGYFYYRKLAPDKIIKFPYMRWSQAPMFKSLCQLYTHQNHE